MKDVDDALARTAEILRGIEHEPTWVIPTSGGKDSTTVWQTVLHLIKKGAIKAPKRIVGYMADTLMEYEIFMSQAVVGLEERRLATVALGIECVAFITNPLPQDDFWVRIIGYGFVPPTGNMRSCTDKLKIVPPRKVLARLGFADAPVLLGVRWGESQRRDKKLHADVLSCKAGGECGPDVQYNVMRKSSTRKHQIVTPVVHWELCAVWDWLTFHAPLDGFNNDALLAVYGPNGNLRYGCWSCPLIYNDTTGEYLAQADKKIKEMIRFASSNFRPGGAAWMAENREWIEKEGEIKQGRLSMAYRMRLYDWLVDFEMRHGVALLAPWQKLAIQAVLAWFDALPAIQRGQQPPEMFPNLVTSPVAVRHISGVVVKTATALARLPLRTDSYHQRITGDACALDSIGAGDYEYLSQTGRMTHWETTEGRAVNVRNGVIYP